MSRLPLLLAVASWLLIVASVFLRPRRRAVVLRFAALFFGYASLNTINWCQPGWCGRFGVPLTYWWWSDEILIINGTDVHAGFSVAALAGDVAIFAVLCTVLAAVRRPARTSSRSAHPRSSASA